MRKTIFVFAISLLAINVAVYSNSAANKLDQQNNKQPSESSKIQSTKNNNTRKVNIPPSIQDVSNPGNQKHQTTREDKHGWYDKLLDFTIADILMVIFSALLALFNYRLWKTTRDLWKVSQDQYRVMDKQADATKDATATAQRSADVLLAIEKAYVIVTATIGKREIFGEDVVDVTIWNDGRTPATIIQFKAIILGKEDALEMEGSDILPGTELGGNKNHPMPFRITKDRVQGVQRGIDIYCHALIEYEDIFQQRYIKKYTWKNKSDISRPAGYWVICNNKELNNYK